MTQEIPQKVSDMLRMTADNSINFYQQVADHIDKLENTIQLLNEKLAQYEELDEQEVDDHK